MAFPSRRKRCVWRGAKRCTRGRVRSPGTEPVGAQARRRSFSSRNWPAALGWPFIDLAKTEVSQEARKKISTKVAFQYSVLPIKFENGQLQVVVSNPFDAAMLSAVQFDARVPVNFALTTRTEIEKSLKKFYGVGAETLDEMAKDDEPLELLVRDKEITEGDQEASVIKFVNQIIWEAFKDRATDIHFEPAEDELRIRYRIDGILHQTPMPPQLKRYQASLISRIKVMSGMNIAEKRLPQDGRINVRIKGEEIDIRVSTVPTVYGESVSLRLLTRGKIFSEPGKAGFSTPLERIAHPRNHHQAARHFPGHRADRFGQIHFALRFSEHDQFGHQAHHHH
jgi:type II secretory ATPase GspE/PulE/Tfp pilus assembly ATPase PilB-like protein